MLATSFSLFVWFAYFAVRFEPAHVGCFGFKYLKSVKGGITADSHKRKTR